MNYEMPEYEVVSLSYETHAEGPDGSSCGKSQGCCFANDKDSGW